MDKMAIDNKILKTQFNAESSADSNESVFRI